MTNGGTASRKMRPGATPCLKSRVMLYGPWRARSLRTGWKHRQILTGSRYFAAEENTGGAVAMVVNSSPSQGGSTRARILYQTLIGSAHKNLKITTPYFLPDDSLRKELARAMQERHVRVQILVPGKHSDHSM